MVSEKSFYHCWAVTSFDSFFAYLCVVYSLSRCSLHMIGVTGCSAGRCEEMEVNETRVPADKKFIVFDKEKALNCMLNLRSYFSKKSGFHVFFFF